MRPITPVATCAALLAVAASVFAAPVHTTYLWHMHRPI
jgi:hypothetical protein